MNSLIKGERQLILDKILSVIEIIHQNFRTS